MTPRIRRRCRRTWWHRCRSFRPRCVRVAGRHHPKSKPPRLRKSCVASAWRRARSEASPRDNTTFLLHHPGRSVRRSSTRARKSATRDETRRDAQRDDCAKLARMVILHQSIGNTAESVVTAALKIGYPTRDTASTPLRPLWVKCDRVNASASVAKNPPKCRREW